MLLHFDYTKVTLYLWDNHGELGKELTDSYMYGRL